MMLNHLWVFLSAFGLGACIAYVWWSLLRVICLREDVFEIRDRLFDAATNLGLLHDQGYRDARASLNAVLQMAGSLSLRLLAFLFVNRDRNGARPVSNDHRLQAVIDQAMNEVSSRVFRYVLRETLTGWLAITTVSVGSSIKFFQQDAQRLVRRAIESSFPRQLPIQAMAE